MLLGSSIPTINITFIWISSTAYPFALSLLASSRNSTSGPRLPRDSISNRVQQPSSKWTKITPRHWTNTLRSIPRTVVRRCSDISPAGIRYSRTCRKEKPPGRCGLNSAYQIEKEHCRKTRLCVAVHTLQVFNGVQAYKAQSGVFMREVISNR